MRVSPTDSVIGSKGTIPGNRQKMNREVSLQLNTAPRWGGQARGMIESRVIANCELTPHDARLLAKALIAEARVVEAARR